MTKSDLIIKKFEFIESTNKFSYLARQLFMKLFEIYKNNREPIELEINNKNLCQYLGSSEKGLIDARRQLEEAGIITYENAGTRKPGIYKFNVVDNVDKSSNIDNDWLNAVIQPVKGASYSYIPSTIVNNSNNYSNQSNQWSIPDFNFKFDVSKEQILNLIFVTIIGGTAIYEVATNKDDLEKAFRDILISVIVLLISRLVVDVFYPKDTPESTTSSNSQKQSIPQSSTSNAQEKEVQIAKPDQPKE